MSYIAYSGLRTPNEVITKMNEYVQTRGYNIVQPIVDDLNIYDMSTSDGKKFTFASRTGDYFINLRSANGMQIFGTTDDAAMDIATPDEDENYTGVGMIVSEGYSASVRWYNQYKIPHNYKSVEVCGVFMPMKLRNDWKSDKNYSVDVIVFYDNKWYICTEAHTSGMTFDNSKWSEITDQTIIDENDYSYTLYCNNVTAPTDTVVFTLMKEKDKYRQCSHLVYSDINKYDIWTGGALFSGSSTIAMMKTANKCYEHEIEADQYILPVLSSGQQSNTFLRIDIDGAPTEERGEILWAASGIDNMTGKKLSMPIRTGQNMNGKIPNYLWLQSRNRLDWGRNINTLNGITIDMPIFAAVLVDPDALDNYAAVGDVTGVYCISTLNTQTSCTYERSYPTSGQMCQVFPHGKRRGHYGFDGISIKQEL